MQRDEFNWRFCAGCMFAFVVWLAILWPAVRPLSAFFGRILHG